MAIVTGRPEAEASWTVNRFGWKRYFPLVVSKERQEGRSKPDPFPLQHALTILAAAGRNIQPGSAAYVGDTVDDMTCARAAGMWAIGFIPPYVQERIEIEQLLRDRGAHVVIHDTEELPDVIENFRERVALSALEGEV
jgi:HAD superfamily phosphatase